MGEPWTRRDDVEQVIAHARQWHPHLEMAVIWGFDRPTPAKRLGATVWATMQKSTPLVRAIASGYAEPAPDYLLVVAAPIWDAIGATLRIPLIDHELCHCGGYNVETDEWLIVGHTVEEHAVVAQRHGTWSPALVEIAAALGYGPVPPTVAQPA